MTTCVYCLKPHCFQWRAINVNVRSRRREQNKCGGEGVGGKGEQNEKRRSALRLLLSDQRFPGQRRDDL